MSERGRAPGHPECWAPSRRSSLLNAKQTEYGFAIGKVSFGNRLYTVAKTGVRVLVDQHSTGKPLTRRDKKVEGRSGKSMEVESGRNGGFLRDM